MACTSGRCNSYGPFQNSTYHARCLQYKLSPLTTLRLLESKWPRTGLNWDQYVSDKTQRSTNSLQHQVPIKAPTSQHKSSVF